MSNQPLDRRSVLNTGLALGLGMTSGLAGCLGSDGSNTQFSPIADELTVWHEWVGQTERHSIR